MLQTAKAALQMETQNESALQKIHQLEDTTRYQRREEDDTIVTQAPRFTTQLNGPTNLCEGQSAHYECRIEPYPDPNLKVEWFVIPIDFNKNKKRFEMNYRSCLSHIF